MHELIARLEKAEAGSLALDREVFAALGFRERRFPMDSCPYWVHEVTLDEVVPVDLERLTTSLDAALALAERVLPGWYPGLQKNRYDMTGFPDDWTAYLSAPRGHGSDGDIEVDAPNPSLALCIAILKAKESA